MVTVGEPMVLFTAQETGELAEVGTFARSTAGAELNVAIGLSRLGLKVGYVSRLGHDSFGRHLLAALDRERIDRRHVVVDEAHPTGFMLKSRSSDGSDPRIEYFRRGSAASHLSLADNPVAYCARSRHLHLTGISPAISMGARELVFQMAAEAREAGRTVSFDPNLRPGLWPSQQAMADCVNQLAAGSDWVMPGLAEGRLLTGLDTPDAIADFYLSHGAKRVIIKLGPQGAFFASATTRGTVAGIPVTSVVDTVGAGDGFAVGVISGLLEGLEFAQAVARGNAIGARVVQFPGDCDGLPTRAELAANQAHLTG